MGGQLLDQTFKRPLVWNPSGSRLRAGFPRSIVRLVEALCVRLGQLRASSLDQIPLVESTHMGSKYSIPSAACLAARQPLARLEETLLDPVCTVKAFAGLLDFVIAVRCWRRPAPE